MDSAEQERAAIVKWLLGKVTLYTDRAENGNKDIDEYRHNADTCYYAAYSIEHGFHLKDTDNG